MFTRQGVTDTRTHWRTDRRTEPQQRYIIPSAMRCAGIKRFSLYHVHTWLKHIECIGRCMTWTHGCNKVCLSWLSSRTRCSEYIICSKSFTKSSKWLIGCFEDLRRFSNISAISRLGSRRLPISEIVAARQGIEPHTSCSASQELNHYTTAAPKSK